MSESMTTHKHPERSAAHPERNEVTSKGRAKSKDAAHHPLTESLTIGDLQFEIRRSPKRKTVGITIDRAGDLILTAPPDCPREQIERAAQEKQFWIYTKLAEKELLFRPAPPKSFVSGEGFYYLGRSYRLLLVNDAALPALSLSRGRFLLQRSERGRAHDHFVRWYTVRGKPWLERRVQLFADRIGVEPLSVQVRDLGYRWGSCSPRGSLHFHWRVILLPPRIVEYLVAHELVHLAEPHHNPEFWSRLERAMPDFAARKGWLAENGWRF